MHDIAHFMAHSMLTIMVTAHACPFYIAAWSQGLQQW
jgi:hypothetical protein